jgi:hypothetical protein
MALSKGLLLMIVQFVFKKMLEANFKWLKTIPSNRRFIPSLDGKIFELDFSLSVPIEERLAKHYFLAFHQHSKSPTRTQWSEANSLSEIISHALARYKKTDWGLTKMTETEKTIIRMMTGCKPSNNHLQCYHVTQLEKKLLLLGKLLHRASRPLPKFTQAEDTEQKIPYVGDLPLATSPNSPTVLLKNAVTEAIQSYQAKKVHEKGSFSFTQAEKLLQAVNKTTVYHELKEIVLGFLTNDKLKTKLAIPMFKTADSDPECHRLKIAIAGKIQALANQDVDLIAVAAAKIGGSVSPQLN